MACEDPGAVVASPEMAVGPPQRAEKDLKVGHPMWEFRLAEDILMFQGLRVDMFQLFRASLLAGAGLALVLPSAIEMSGKPSAASLCINWASSALAALLPCR